MQPRKPSRDPIKGFKLKHGALIPKRESRKDMNSVKFAKLLIELEGINPKLLNTSDVQSLEIDRSAARATYDQHVELLQEFVDEVKKELKKIK